MVAGRADYEDAAADAPIEERVFEYARGACGVGSEQAAVVVQQVIDLAHGDIAILQRACAYCEASLKHLEHRDADDVLDLLNAAIEKRGREQSGGVKGLQRASMSPKRVAALALVLAEENAEVSRAEAELLVAVDHDPDLLEAARDLALSEFAAGLAAGDTCAITGLSILEGAYRRVRG